MRWLFVVCFMFPLFLASGTLFGAESYPQSEAGQFRESDERMMISRISFHRTGFRTSESLIRRVLLMREGEHFSKKLLNKSLQDLKNMAVFSHVDAKVVGRSDGIDLLIELEEKWTTLPDLRFGGGGGVTFYRVGIYDINWFGQLVEGLISYENFAGTHNGEVWFSNPDAFGKDVLGGFSIKRTTNYQNEFDSNRKLQKTVSFVRGEASIESRVKISESLSVGMEMISQKDRYTEEYLNAEQRSANEGKNIEWPTGGVTGYLGPKIVYRDLDRHGIDQKGIQIESAIRWAAKGLGGDNTNTYSRLKIKAFQPFFLGHLGLRIEMTQNTSDLPHHAVSLGGLNEVRGYFDAEVNGSKAWFSNLELRHSLLNIGRFVLQDVFFTDAGQVGSSWHEAMSKQSLLSYGLGLRLVPTFIHLVAIRLDYAVRSEDRGGGLSFGFIQFF